MKAKALLAPILVVGTLVSIILSLILYIADPLKVESSLIFGLLGIVISLLIDSISRTQQLEDRVLKTIGLTGQIVKDTWFSERIVDVIQTWERIQDLRHPLFASLAQLCFSGCRYNIQAPRTSRERQHEARAVCHRKRTNRYW